MALPQRPDSDTFEDKLLMPEPSPEPVDIEDEEKEPEEAEEAEKEEPEVAFQPSTIISSPLSVIETTPPPAPEPTFQPTPEPALQPMGTGRYYLVFVNTPAHSLVKSKIPIEFDVFPVITIGRSPENVVVIPDQEVSRKHAELTAEGSKLLLKDLKSKNGTFVYDGKKFEQVSDSVEVEPNTILKFGTGTIVKLVSE